MEQQKTWVRIGLNGHLVRAGKAGWRIFFGNDLTEINVRAWKPQGQCLPGVNHITGSSQTGDRRGLVGWIDVFGICTIKEGILYIVLEIPIIPPPEN